METESTNSQLADDYSTVTELPGSSVSREQLARLFHRYHMAIPYVANKRVLEVACGAGLGLGYLSRSAGSIWGGDYTAKLLHVAQASYRGRIPLLRLDAHSLPIRGQSFDVVIFYEAIYYLAHPEEFIEGVRRVLRENGVFLIATVNKDWPEFNHSPFSTRYFSVPELRGILQNHGFRVECFGAFSSLPKGWKGKAITHIRKLAVSLHLIPKTMKGKEFLKRVFYGRLAQLKGEIEEGISEYFPPVPIPCDAPNFEYKVIYVVARI